MLREYSGFDTITTAQLYEGLFTDNEHVYAAAPAILPGQGRRVTQCLRVYTQNIDFGRSNIRRTLDAQQTWGAGFAFRTSNLTQRARDLCGFLDVDTVQISLGFNTDGTLSARRGSTVLGTSSRAITATTYYYLELLATIHASAGIVQVRMNNELVLDLSGINTQTTANAFANVFYFGSMMTVGSLPQNYMDYDDWYLFDGQAGPITTFIGDCRVDTLRPVSDVVSDFIPSTGSDNYAMVDDATPDGDATYNQSVTVGATDRFVFETLPALTNPTIYAVKINLYARNPEPGIATIAGEVESNGTIVDGTARSLGGTYLLLSNIFEEDPDTTDPWEQAGVNAATFGYTVVS